MKALIAKIALALKGPPDSDAEGLGIQPAKDPKSLALAWRESRLSTQALAPGTAESRSFNDLGEASEIMCSIKAGAWLTAAFGPAKSVGETGAAARMHAMEFRGKTILAIYQRERGVSWQVALGEASDPAVDGRSYGKAVLLSWDKEARDFWPAFCQRMSDAMREEPMAFKARMEAEQIEASAGPALKSAPGLRM